MALEKKDIKKEQVKKKPVRGEQKKHEKSAYCVYIGPSISGLIQGGTVYEGDIKKVKKLLSGAIEKYPLIEKLIVTDKTFVVDRLKVKQQGNSLNAYFNKLNKEVKR